MNDQVYIVIPAKDEASRVGRVIQKTQLAGFDNIVIVNDGSSDATGEIAKQLGAFVINHPVNLGPGAATQTGILYALKRGAQVVVTVDADGQHSPSDIDKLVHTLQKENLDIVIGSRFLNHSNSIPPIRIFYNKIANLITFFLTGISVTDSQSGMKAMSRRFAHKCKLNFNGFEFCVEIIRNIRLSKATYKEIPIQVMYSEDTLSKGQNLWSGIRMLGKLFKIF